MRICHRNEELTSGDLDNVDKLVEMFNGLEDRKMNL